MTVEPGKNISVPESGERDGTAKPESACSEALESQAVEGAKSLGLDPDRILAHWRRLFSSGSEGGGLTFELLDTCRTDNGRLFKLESFSSCVDGSDDDLSGYAAFVPAAGAASRYMAALEPLRKSVEAWDVAAIKSALKALEAYRSVLPDMMHHKLSRPADGVEASDLKWLAELFTSPKALLPCGPGGTSFLEQKAREHHYFDCLNLQIFVTPPGMVEKFRSCLSGEPGPETVFFEQGKACSTLRFTPQGLPARGEDGGFSQVPSGHGALADLFPVIAKEHPQVEALFIRNIDNVCGVNARCRDMTRTFLKAHRSVLKAVKEIRDKLNGSNDPKALDKPRRVLESVVVERPLSAEEQTFLSSISKPGDRSLWTILFKLFQTPLSEAGQGGAPDLLRLFLRPVTFMGQVQNLGHDKGGSPVVIQTEGGPVSLCLERPHASFQDQSEILDNPEKATHFNPVFVATELQTQPQFNDAKTDFWLTAKKTWQGKKVIYYETVLYEVLGNCKTMNCLFVEIPRFAFNPRKSLSDALVPVDDSVSG